MPRLVIEKGPDKGVEKRLRNGDSVVVGREATGGIRLRDVMASRLHFRIDGRTDGFILVDMQSRNGTFLNGRNVNEAALHVGDSIQVGETLFSFAGDETRDPLIGERLAGYRVIERIGRGGMGTVYKAEQVDLRRVVAVKVISPEYARDREFIERFIREARAAAALNHPNIVQVYDVKKHQDVYFFSMEFLTGGSVQGRISVGRKLDPDAGVKMIVEAASGLAFAHRKNIVHRDVKPDNMMLGESDLVKVGDMGLASSPEEIRKDRAEEKYVLGTPHYIAPEQLQGQPADFRSDVYALGSSLYRMLAGQPPFPGNNAVDIVRRKVREDAKPLVEAAPAVPKALSDIVMHMIDRDPGKRPASMDKVVQLLEEYRGGGRGRTSVGVLEYLRRRPLVGGIVAASTLVVIAGIVTAAIVFGPGEDGGNGNGANGNDHGPVIVEGATPEERARLAFFDARDFEDGISIGDEAQIGEAITRYEAVAAEHATMPEAERAREAVERLAAVLQGLRADRAMQSAESEEIRAYNEFLAGFARGEADEAIIRDRAIGGYRAVAEQFPETGAEEDASARADHIGRWLTRLGEEHDRWQRALEAFEEANRNREWGRAMDELRGFVDDSVPMAGSFASDRYTSLLYGEMRIQSEIDRLGTAIETDFESLRTEIAALSARNEMETYRQAIVMITTAEARFRNTDFAPDLEAMLNTTRASMNALGDRLASEELARRRREEEEDVNRFRAACMDAAERTRAADFADALGPLTQARDAFHNVEFIAMMQRRIALVEAARQYLERWVTVANGSDARIFNRSVQIGSVRGRVIGADAERMIVEAGPGIETSVELEPERDVARFLECMERYRTRTPLESYQLAMVCWEVGRIGAMLQHLREAEEGGDAEAGRRAREFREAFERVDVPDTPEVAAGRYLAYLEELIAGRQYEEAAEVLAIVRGRLGQTTAVRGAQQRLTEIDGILEGEEVDPDAARREEVRTAVAQIMQQETDRMRETAEGFWQRLQRIPSTYEYEMWKAGFLLAIGRPLDASERVHSYVRGDGNLSVREIAEAARLDYISLVVAGGAAERRMDEYEARVGEYDYGDQFADMRTWCETWQASYNDRERQLQRARDQIEMEPLPESLYTGAEMLAWKGAYGEARPCLRALIERFPDAVRVRSGDALWLLAESCYQSGDYAEARTLFAEFLQQYPDHERASEVADNARQRRNYDIPYRAEVLGLPLE